MSTCKVAAVVSDVLGPLPAMAGLCGAGIRQRGPVAGALWGLVAILFAGLAPYVLTWRLRHPASGMPTQAARVAYMSSVAGAALLGVLVLDACGAPSAVVRMTAAILVMVLIQAAANLRWRWSNHGAAVSAGIGLLVTVCGRVALPSVIALLVVGWARIHLKRHDLAEMVGGAVVGLVAPLCYLVW